MYREVALIDGVGNMSRIALKGRHPTKERVVFRGDLLYALKRRMLIPILIYRLRNRCRDFRRICPLGMREPLEYLIDICRLLWSREKKRFHRGQESL